MLSSKKKIKTVSLVFEDGTNLHVAPENGWFRTRRNHRRIGDTDRYIEYLVAELFWTEEKEPLTQGKISSNVSKSNGQTS